MSRTNAARATATRRDIVRRINAKLAPKLHFLVTRREHAPAAGVYQAGRWLVSYCLAGGDPSRPTTWIDISGPVDIVDMAFRWGVHLTDAELGALGTTRMAA